MTYHIQQVNSLADIKTAIETTLSGEGWSLANGVLHRGAVYARLVVDGDWLHLHAGTGASGGSVTGGPQGGGVARLGAIIRAGANTPIPFPARLMIFVFDTEVYAVLNMNVEEYQYLAFGQSGAPGIPGTGVWFAGTLPKDVSGYNGGNAFNMNPMAGGQSNDLGSTSACAIFWMNIDVPYWRGDTNSYIHHGYTDAGAANAWVTTLAQLPLAPLLNLQPNAWNSESVLLPLRAYVERPEGKSSLAGELQNARLLRIDYLDPEQIVTLGPDRWMVFPWFKKNIAARDGTTGGSILHSGTLGWAIRVQ
ncbi:MAG: hypothetical protein LBF93_10730 [Zoogloeaceae bacterium]|jgi:hypothetical protein|nr:hypothetical protein [Zoogloeaceae bacterium]